MLTICSILLLGSCQRNELCYDHRHGDVHVRVVWDLLPEALQSHLPESVCISFYGTQTTWQAPYTYYRGTLGGEVDVPDGSYGYLVYNSDTEMIGFRGMERLETAEAFLSERTRTPYGSRGSNHTIDYADNSVANTATRNQTLMSEPDRLFASCTGPIAIDAQQMKRPQSFDVHPGSRVQMVTITIAVTGLEGAQSCRASLSGAARSIKLGATEFGKDTGTIIFDMDMSDKTKLTQTICVFGMKKSPEGTPDDESIQHLLRLEFLMRDNKVVEYEFDVKGLIDFCNTAPEAIIPILVEEEIILPEPEQPESGFDADISDWGDEINIYL